MDYQIKGKKKPSNSLNKNCCDGKCVDIFNFPYIAPPRSVTTNDFSLLYTSIGIEIMYSPLFYVESHLSLHAIEFSPSVTHLNDLFFFFLNFPSDPMNAIY